MSETIASAKHFAAIGDDGRRPVVWGVGDTDEEALADARSELRQAGATSELRVVEITAERRAAIEAGDVDAEGL